MSTSGSKSNEHVAHFLVDIYTLLKKYDIEPKIYYIKTPKEVVMERIRKRNGNHQNDIILTEQTASTYYDHFQPPTDEEGEVIVVEGY